jgi:hypothetical protein
MRQHKKRGRRDQGLHEQPHINVAPDLKEWVMQQPGDAAAFVRSLLEKAREEYERQQRPEPEASHLKNHPNP